MAVRVSVLSVAGTALLTLAACAGAPPADEFTRADVAAIKQATRDLASAMNAGNTGSILAHYPENVVLMPPNSGTLRGRDWVKGYYDTLLAGKVDVTFESKDVAGHGPIAYENGNYTMITRGANGEETRDRGKYLFVLHKFNGEWKYEYAIWNSDLPKPTSLQANTN